MKRLPNPYYKYNLDIQSPFIAVIKTPYKKHMEDIINLFHYGKSIQLKWTKPFIVKGLTRYIGQYYLTKLGRIKIRF